MFDGMVKERSLSCDSAAAWEIEIIVRSGSIVWTSELLGSALLSLEVPDRERTRGTVI